MISLTNEDSQQPTNNLPREPETTVPVAKSHEAVALRNLARGRALARRKNAYAPEGKGRFVTWASDGKKKHHLAPLLPDGQGPPWKCSCKDYYRRGLAWSGDPAFMPMCKHGYGLQAWLERWPSVEGIDLAPKKQYPQENASAYNWALRNAGEDVPRLAYHLAGLIPEPERFGPGRPGIPLRDKVVCAVLYAYHGAGAREAEDAARRAYRDGLLTKAWTFSAMSKFFNRPDAVAILDRVLRWSALPLQPCEREAGVDSTHFTSPRLGTAYLPKPNVVADHKTLKAHLVVGLRTHVVVGATVTMDHGEGSADETQFRPLMTRAVSEDGWHFANVYADAAYGNRGCVNVLEQLGIRPVIDLPSNVNHDGGREWKKLHAFHTLTADRFRAEYHLRSNQESVHSAVKRLLGARLRCRTLLSQTAEIYAKLVAYNLLVLNYERYAQSLTGGWMPQAPIAATA